jgi:hypothetical protein
MLPIVSSTPHLVPARGRAVGPSGRGLAPTVEAGSLELCKHTCNPKVRTASLHQLCQALLKL